MLTLIRSQSRLLMAFLLVIIGLAFIVFYNIPSFERLHKGDLGTIQGRTITAEDFQEAEQATELTVSLQYGGRIPTGAGVNRFIQQQTWQRMLVLSTAQDLDATASDDEVLAYIQKLPFLQKEGKFQPEMWQQFSDNFLRSKGVSPQRFEQIVREEIMLEKVFRAVSSPVHVTAAEVREGLDRILGQVKFSVIRFNVADYTARVTVTPEEISAYYNNHSQENDFRTLEKRKVSYASFAVPPSVAKLPEKEKKEARRQIGEKAIELGIALLDRKDARLETFQSSATTAGAQVNTTGFFAPNETPAGVPASPNFNQAAFRLSSQNPVSDVVETDGAFYLLHYVAEQPSEVLPLQGVSPVIETRLRQEKAAALAANDAAAAISKLRESLAKGTSFAAATTALQLKTVSVPAFSPRQGRDLKDDAATVLPLTRTTEAGQLSDYIPSATGGIIAYLESRTPPPADAVTKEESGYRAQLENSKKSEVISAWIDGLSKSKGTRPPPQLASAE